MAEMPGIAKVWEQLPDGIVKAPVSAMSELLEIIEDRWGDAEGFALSYGVKPQTIERLREAFLV